jgi:hypothetical protein
MGIGTRLCLGACGGGRERVAAAGSHKSLGIALELKPSPFGILRNTMPFTASGDRNTPVYMVVGSSQRAGTTSEEYIMEGLVKVGMWGGGSDDLRDIAVAPHRLESVVVCSGWAVDSVSFTYTALDGTKHEVGRRRRQETRGEARRDGGHRGGVRDLRAVRGAPLRRPLAHLGHQPRQ